MNEVSAGRWVAKLAALDANLLVALDALLEEGNVTSAAARVGITQPAMSQTLGRLRDHFDDPILVRAGRQMQPTPFARRIHARLHAAISELEAVVRDRPQFDPARASRRFVVATVDYLALMLVPPLQQALADRAPGVDVAIHALGAGAITPKLEAGVIDLYLGVRGDTEQGMTTQLLFRESFSVVVRRGHPMLGRPLTVADYVRWSHIHVSPRRERGSIVERALAGHGLDRRVALEVPYFGLVPAVLRDSDLVATVPARLARWFARWHDLAVLAPPIKLGPAPICTAWHPRFEREPGLVWLRTLVAELALALEA